MNKDHTADTAKKLDDKKHQESGKSIANKSHPSDSSKHQTADKMHETTSDQKPAVKLAKKAK